MTHVFVSPHPDDIALSCGGLVAELRGRGEEVAIVTVFGGPGTSPSLTDYQRDALGFGGADGAGTGAATRAAGADGTGAGTAPSAAAAMAGRRGEDERYARSIGAQIVSLELPDAVFRGYEGESRLMNTPRPGDEPPIEPLARELGRLEPQRVYFPLGVGNHVDHQLTRAAGIALLGRPLDSPSGSAAASPGLVGRLLFYEDFPYAQRVGFEQLDQLPGHALVSLPPGVSLVPEYTELGRLVERKIEGIRVYESQVDSLFGSDQGMVDAVRSRGIRVGQLGGIGPAERYWRTIRS